jgi:glycosyltransferase involved in cell wall biosynthesis
VQTEGFTTVANWRGYGSVVWKGRRYGQKAHSLRKLVALPERVNEGFVLALAIHPAEKEDLAILRRCGWELTDPRKVAGLPQRYADFVRGSKGELGIAKEGYVESRCGWFSDRSACYLASGRPVVAQDTGFPRHLPVGEGLIPFSSTEEAAAAIETVASDYGRHAKAARALAESFFDSKTVLGRLLEQVGATTAIAPDESR